MTVGEVNTVNDVLMEVISRGSQTVLLRPASAEAAGSVSWQPLSASEFYGQVRALAERLQRWGVQRGDRVAILSENRWEWAVADFAILSLGAVGVPLYATNTSDQVGYMIEDSGAKVAFVSNGEQRSKLRGGRLLPGLERVIVMNPGEEAEDQSFSAILEGASAKQERDPVFDDLVRSVQPNDLCTIIYTSGTTGEPKGVELTHGNIASNVAATMPLLPMSEADIYIDFLPLSHIYARNVDYLVMLQGAVLAHCAQFDRLPEMMKAIRPTIFVGVPRVFEKIRQGVEGKSAASPFKRRVLAWAVATGRNHREEVLAGHQATGLPAKVADRLVFSKIRDAFGGRVRIFTSGSAALGMDTAGWFADVGIRIYEGYGLTETSPIVSVNHHAAHRIGSVGQPLGNVEVRLAADGELEVRGPSIFRRYWKKARETEDVFTEDGWFRTGDIGSIDQDGYLQITDRKKEILKTSGGKMIAPQPIEGRLKSNALVGNAALVGDKHKFACVLISPNLAALTHWASQNKIGSKDATSLLADARVLAEYQRIVDEVNRSLAPFETMKRMKVVREEWTIESGEITPSQKLKRRIVEQKYAAEIAAFYQDESTARE